jgi:hypothetical protein
VQKIEASGIWPDTDMLAAMDESGNDFAPYKFRFTIRSAVRETPRDVPQFELEII